MFKKTIATLFLLLAFSLTAQTSLAADLSADVHALQVAWAKANYELKDDAQIEAFESLIEEAKATTEKYPDSAESWIWLGIIQSTYAGKASPFSALSHAEAAKESLEKALEINPKALKGSAYTSLGTLYFKVPGWPLGFGDDDKAASMLEKSVQINPDGIDSNYFYADFLADQDQYADARKHLLIAKAAPARPDRPIADKGRHQEIMALLKKVNEELEEETSSGDDLD